MIAPKPPGSGLFQPAERSHHTMRRLSTRIGQASEQVAFYGNQNKIFIRESSMRSKLMLSFAASAAVVLFHPTTSNGLGAGPGGADRHGQLRGRRQHGRRRRHRQKARLDRRGQRDHRRAGPLRVPGEPPRPGRICAEHPRGRLRHRRPDQGEGGSPRRPPRPTSSSRRPRIPPASSPTPSG